MQHALWRRERLTSALSDHGILICSATLLLAWLACVSIARPFHLPDEGRYAAVAWEMLDRSSWLVPRLDGLPYFEKPPLYYWLAACAMNVFGANEFAARVPALVGAAVAGMALFDLCSRWCGRTRAGWIVVVWFATPLTFLALQFANMDMLVAGLITWSTCSFADAILRTRAGQPSRGSLLLAYAAAAFGVLAKGLIGIVLPVLIIGSWLAWQRRPSEALTLLRWPGITLFALIAAPWFIAVQAAFPGFAHFFFVVQHLQRFAASGFNNIQPFWFYALVLLGFCLPWLAWTRLAWIAARAAARPSPTGGDAHAESVRALMLVWAIVVFIFFSIPQSKLIGYIIPAAPPIAYFVGSALAVAAEPSRARSASWVIATVVVAIAASVSAVAGFALYDHKTDRPIGRYLAEHRRSGEPIVMLEEYRFDIPFYAVTHDPVLYVANWSSPDVATRDDIRRELYSAASFVPERRARVLIDTKDLRSKLCDAPKSWVVASADAALRFPELAKHPVEHAWKGVRLWKVDALSPAARARLGCVIPTALSGN